MSELFTDITKAQNTCTSFSLRPIMERPVKDGIALPCLACANGPAAGESGCALGIIIERIIAKFNGKVLPNLDMTDIMP